MRIGAHALRNQLFVAPMAGITDRPFRRLARRVAAAQRAAVDDYFERLAA